MSQQARNSKYEREKTAFVVSAYTTIKLKFHGTDTDTDSDTDTRILVRKSACPTTSPFSLPRAGHAQQSSPTCPPTWPIRALFLAWLMWLLPCFFIHFCRAVSYITQMRFHHQLMRFHKTAYEFHTRCPLPVDEPENPQLKSRQPH